MYFLYEFLITQSSLSSHQAWLLLLLFFVTSLFSAAARVVKDEQGERDPALLITATFMAALFLERALIVACGSQWPQAQAGFCPESWWRLLRHGALVLIEAPIYALVWILLRDSARKWLKGKLRKWLKSDV